MNEDQDTASMEIMTASERAVWLLHEFAHLAGMKLPYVYGGGHGVAPDRTFGTFPPTKGVNPEGVSPPGYDCSGWQSAGLWHAGMLGSGAIHDTNLAPGTEELEGWGSAGPGHLFTLYVRDSGVVHHTVSKITLPNSTPLWTAANRPGTVCGFQNFGGWDPTKEGYAARHFPGM